jgi:hypothetical protein
MADLKTVEIVVGGTWGDARRDDVHAVLQSARECALAGVSLPTDNVPSCIKVCGALHRPQVLRILDRCALILLDVEGRLWAKLAYQFGHELGHVVANSWGANAVSRLPCDWLEEALVEAFSVTTLFKMADRWSVEAPFPNWTSYAASLRAYASGRTAELQQSAVADASAWFRAARPKLETLTSLEPEIWPFIPWLIDHFKASCDAADLAALNRWPERSLPIDEYLTAWDSSCERIGTAGRLPTLVRERLEL